MKVLLNYLQRFIEILHAMRIAKTVLLNIKLCNDAISVLLNNKVHPRFLYTIDILKIKVCCTFNIKLQNRLKQIN